MRAVLDGQAPRNADRHHAEGVLRLFGLEPEDAAEVARRPMPKIPPARVRAVVPSALGPFPALLLFPWVDVSA